MTMGKEHSGIGSLFESSIGQLAESFGKALKGALAKYEELRLPATAQQDHIIDTKSLLTELSDKHKGELSHIYISFLLSSVLCKLPLIRIDLYDENDIADTLPCFAYWDAEEISHSLYKEAELIAERHFEEENVPMPEHEVERAWLNLAEDCFGHFERCLPEILGKCEVAELEKCKVHYGHYLGSTVALLEPRKHAGVEMT